MIKSSIAYNLKMLDKARHLKGWLWADLATHSGLSRQTISGFFHKKQKVSPRAAARIADALEIDLEKAMLKPKAKKGRAAA